MENTLFIYIYATMVNCCACALCSKCRRMHFFGAKLLQVMFYLYFALKFGRERLLRLRALTVKFAEL